MKKTTAEKIKISISLIPKILIVLLCVFNSLAVISQNTTLNVFIFFAFLLGFLLFSIIIQVILDDIYKIICFVIDKFVDKE